MRHHTNTWYGVAPFPEFLLQKHKYQLPTATWCLADLAICSGSRPGRIYSVQKVSRRLERLAYGQATDQRQSWGEKIGLASGQVHGTEGTAGPKGLSLATVMLRGMAEILALVLGSDNAMLAQS